MDMLSYVIMLAVTFASISVCVLSLGALRNTVAENVALKAQIKLPQQHRETKDGEPTLVEVAIPLGCVGTVRCDALGIHHVEVFGGEYDTDEETYQRVVEARDAHFRHMRERGVEV